MRWVGGWEGWVGGRGGCLVRSGVGGSEVGGPRLAAGVFRSVNEVDSSARGGLRGVLTVCCGEGCRLVGRVSKYRRKRVVDELRAHEEPVDSIVVSLRLVEE